jgi:hypothetical protein
MKQTLIQSECFADKKTCLDTFALQSYGKLSKVYKILTCRKRTEPTRMPEYRRSLEKLYKFYNSTRLFFDGETREGTENQTTNDKAGSLT